MRAPVAEQQALLELQVIDSAIERLLQRRANLPEDARLAELRTSKAAGLVTSPKELTSIQAEVSGLRRRIATLEDDLLERMETRETLEAELTELTERGQVAEGERTEVT